MNGPCPACEEPDGFHDQEIHTLIRAYVSEAVKRRREFIEELRRQREQQGAAAGNPAVGGTGSAQAASGADSTSDGDGAAARTPVRP